jgi:hypothetical protein
MKQHGNPYRRKRHLTRVLRAIVFLPGAYLAAGAATSAGRTDQASKGRMPPSGLDRLALDLKAPNPPAQPIAPKAVGTQNNMQTIQGQTNVRTNLNTKKNYWCEDDCAPSSRTQTQTQTQTRTQNGQSR